MKKILWIMIVLFFTLSLFPQDAMEIDADGKIWVLVNGQKVNLQEYLIPVGSVNAFVGDNATVPDGWLICDGRKINKSTNPEYTRLVDLLQAIGNGDMNHPYVVGCTPDEANLPDLRGRFLRGADNANTPAGDADRDPDEAARVNKDGTEVGGVVGSEQEDDFKSHGHMQGDHYQQQGDTGFGSFSNGYTIVYAMSQTTGGNETRSKNVYVNFIIKY